MKTITFKPSGFINGNSYKAELILNNFVVETTLNLVNNNQYEYQVNVPGTYLLKVTNITNSICVYSEYIQGLFPIVNYNESTVDCNTNTYTFDISVLNPITAGFNIQYGWSLVNNCENVNNWGTIDLILPADDIIRYVFIRNTSCCNFVASSVKSPCVTCTLTVTNISFNCNG